MEESWINLNLQQNQARKATSHEEDSEDVISGSSTSSSASSSAASLQNPLVASGTTDEKLGESLGALMENNTDQPEGNEPSENRERLTSEKPARRDTITPETQLADLSREYARQAREVRAARRRSAEREEASYWSGFRVGMSVGVSTILLGLACWRFSFRVRM